MNFWLVAAGVLLLALIPCGWVVLRSEMAEGLAALQVAGAIATAALLLLAVGYARPSSADVGLGLAVLTFPATLVFAHFLERWL